MEKKLEDHVILKNVFEALQKKDTKLTLNSFSKRLKFKSAMSIYNVIKSAAEGGGKPLTEDMINRIILYFPGVNYLYLKHGTGSMFIDRSRNNSNLPLLGLENEETTPEQHNAFVEFSKIPEVLNRIESSLLRIESLLEK